MCQGPSFRICLGSALFVLWWAFCDGATVEADNDVRVPLADGRELVMPRYTQPEAEHQLVLEKLGCDFPPQPPLRIRRSQLPNRAKRSETKSKM